MKKTCYAVCLLLALIFLQGCTQFTELEVNGPSNEKLDIVLVPSHYYGPDAGGNSQWVKDAEAIKKRLLEHHFWKKYRKKINMYMLDVSTPDDFYQSDESWVPDQAKIKAFALEHFPSLDLDQNDQIIFVIESVAHKNDPKYVSGLTRGDPNILQLETAKIGNVVHEFGHSFGRLGDEYNFVINISDWKSLDPNIASVQSGNTCDDKWGDLNNVVIDAPGTWMESEDWRDNRIVGCDLATDKEMSKAEGFRPTNLVCIMNQVGDKFPFCPVCQRQLVTLLNQYKPNDKPYDQVEIFHNPSEFKKATINPRVINFDQMTNRYPRLVSQDWLQPDLKPATINPRVINSDQITYKYPSLDSLDWLQPALKPTTVNPWVINSDQIAYKYPSFASQYWLQPDLNPATINPWFIYFDYSYPVYHWLEEFTIAIDAPDPEGVLARRLYAQYGVSFTSGVIKMGHDSRSKPNVLGVTSINPTERTLIAGYFFSRRICAVGIYNTGSTGVTLFTYNAAFLKTESKSVYSNKEPDNFIGIRATEPIYRFEIDGDPINEISVDDLTFGECPK